jgi:hypothetical protein
MTPNSGNLAGLQAWLQKAIITPWKVREEQIESSVKRGGPLTPVQRVAIYSRAYQGRLIECMQNEFPVLLFALERDLFVRFASEYLMQCPSRSYTLTELGKNFPTYLAKTAPDEPWAKFIIELAVLERAFCEVFHSQGYEGSAQVPSSESCEITLEPNSRELSFTFPVDRYFTDVRKYLLDTGELSAPHFPCLESVDILVYRRDYRVQLRRLNQ